MSTLGFSGLRRTRILAPIRKRTPVPVRIVAMSMATSLCWELAELPNFCLTPNAE